MNRDERPPSSEVALTDREIDLFLPKGAENCTAGFYLGSVLTKREVWAEAAAAFDSAMVCYDERANDIAAKLAEVRSSTKGSAMTCGWRSPRRKLKNGNSVIELPSEEMRVARHHHQKLDSSLG